MTVASDADEAWWPPTLRPSTFSRMWLALWIIHDDSHSTFFSSSERILSVSAIAASGLALSRDNPTPIGLAISGVFRQRWRPDWLIPP